MLGGVKLSQWIFLALGAGGFATGLVAPTPPQSQPKLVFSRDILPILSDKCFKCHGPDISSRMANLRLDVKEGAFANRSGKFPIVPGKPEHSVVVHRITSKDDPMPPTDSGKSLTKEQVALISRWIKEGATYNRLWSLEPVPATVAIPKTGSTWPKDPIDQFILARIKKANLTPSAEASRSRWLRRVTLDLTGLPPTENDISSFIADKSATAYEKVVDRLLASPHYGERIATEWLDAARYSDSYGYQSDLLMPSWPYRDWVVKAFNENEPYNEFLTDQIAGDLRKNPTQDQRLATAFNRLHRQSNEGGSIALEYKTEYASDRVSTFGTAVLGLTLGCAKCHDHKFDPISQKEYFQLFGYFNSIEEYGLLLSTEIVPTPSLMMPTKEQQAKRTTLEAARAQAASNLTSVVASSTARFDKWIDDKPTVPEIPDLTAYFAFDNEPNAKFKNDLPGAVTCDRIGSPQQVPGRTDSGLLLDGENGIVFRKLNSRERWDPFTWSFWVEDPRTAQGPTVLLHRTGGTDVGFCGFDLTLENGYLTARVMRHWPGNAVAIRTKTPIPAKKWTNIAWSYDGLSKASGLKLYVDGKETPSDILNDKLWKSINAYGDHGPSGGDWSFGQRFREAGFKSGKIDDVAYAERNLTAIEIGQLYDKNGVVRMLMDRFNKKAELRPYYLGGFDKEYRAALALRQQAEKAIVQFEDGIQEISVMEEAPKEIPSYLLFRGNYDAPRTEQNRVRRDVPKALPLLKASARNDRLALAQWATRGDNPLTARVAVNRLWQMMFGVGLVETSENFGVQGTQPTHPELLDHLARTFMDSSWNVKVMLRRIALSATYRQDSVRNAKQIKVDPENKLYARGPSQRLSAEMIRDVVLSSSGLLNDKLGGPPVNPYQPKGIWTENNTMSPQFVQGKGPDLYRRSLYSTVKRTTPVPSMLLFDATSREACAVRRPATSTPLQALVLLNDIQYVEAARVLADRVLTMNVDDSERVKVVFRRLTSREADATEVALLLRTYQEQQKEFAKDVESAKKLVGMGETKATATLNVADLAAMTVTVQMVLNSDSVVWKR